MSVNLLPLTGPLPPRERRHLLKATVAALAAALDALECSATREELQALAKVCDDNHLHVEATRVRRWLGESQ